MKAKHYLIILLLGLGPALLAAGTWPAWRGGTLQGHAPSASAPILWSAESNVVWKAVLPGEGYSSPIASEDAVYLTVVTKPAGLSVVNPIAKTVEFALLLLMVGAGFHGLISSHRAVQVQSPVLRQWGMRIGPAAALGVVAGVALFADSVFHFDALSPTSQLAVGAGFSAIFFGGAWVTGTGRRIRGQNLVVSIASMIVAGAAIVVWAQRGSQWTQMWKAPLTLAAGLGFFAIGVLHAGLVLGAGGTQEPVRSRASGWIVPGTRIGAALLALAACGVVIRLFLQAQGLATLTFDSYNAAIPAWSWWVMLLPALAALAFARRRSNWREAGLALSMFVAAPLLVALLLEAGLVHIRYLRHVLLVRVPAWEASFGWGGVCICLFCAALAIAAGLRGRAGAARNSGRARTLFRFASMGLGFVTLMHWGGIVPRLAHFGDSLSLMAVDRASGKTLWVRRAADAPAKFERLNSRATPTAVTWSNRVCAYFGTQGLFCFDASGQRLWNCTELPCESLYGPSISPVFCDGRIFVSSEPSTQGPRPAPVGYLAAVDSADGTVLWKKPRPAIENHTGNYATPLVLNVAGTNLIVVWGGEFVTAYDPISGGEIWNYKFSGTHVGKDLVASPVADGEKLYLPIHDAILAVSIARLTSKEEPLAWRSRCPGLYCSSPVVANGLLFAVSDQGLVFCMDSQTGELVWKKKLKGTHYSSAIVAGGCVYFCSTEGRTTAFRCDRSGQIVAENELNERVVASFAPVDGRLFIRSQTQLYCVGR